MTPTLTRTLAAMTLSCAFLLTGCSREPERGPVSGVVTLDGKPLPNVVVVFVPDAGQGTPGARSVARTDTDGHYVIFTDKDQDGASVGTHRVSLYDPLSIADPDKLPVMPGKENEPARKPKGPPPSRVPKPYTDVLKTPLQPVEVGRGAQTYDIHLKSK